MNLEEECQKAIQSLKSMAERHWLMILAGSVLLLSSWMYTLTYSNFLWPFMFFPMWYISAVAFKNREEDRARARSQKQSRRESIQLFTVYRVYTNDSDFSDYMHDETYFNSQLVYTENRALDLSYDMRSQIPFIERKGYRFCYHLVLDQDDELYFAGNYEV
ncbi:hypothetical protein M4D76_17705 [Peribacillus frigoritolerans]|uniref:hypothetical protein n=1 Tax=Peribacillus frigoritolerans TaxID=450367 RepID=UPI0021A5875E|nr:hypothetical protein [Peribacillus frigoritolerans]MCT1390135.1 hypothetical protein [Peribacillus frigoritolerans]